MQDEKRYNVVYCCPDDPNELNAMWRRVSNDPTECTGLTFDDAVKTLVWHLKDDRYHGNTNITAYRLVETKQ